jgi:hypothetical protein
VKTLTNIDKWGYFQTSKGHNRTGNNTKTSSRIARAFGTFKFIKMETSNRDKDEIIGHAGEM